jgi:hypothetical protein
MTSTIAVRRQLIFEGSPTVAEKTKKAFGTSSAM